MCCPNLLKLAGIGLVSRSTLACFTLLHYVGTGREDACAFIGFSTRALEYMDEP